MPALKTCNAKLMTVMQLQQILYTQGFGTRRVCAGLVQRGLVRYFDQKTPLSPVQAADPAIELEAEGLRFEVMGEDWTYHDKAYLMLHKPAGFECSQKPSAWPSVYSLLPAPLRQRPVRGAALPGVQAAGRLDQDTTGLLLLSDDGAFLHRMASPKTHLPKVYEVTTKHAVDATQVGRLLAGVVLDDAPQLVRAAACERSGERLMRLTLTEGRYHQVKRMVAAVGNRVDALHRARIGALDLPADLAPGRWRWLDADALRRLAGDRAATPTSLNVRAAE